MFDRDVQQNSENRISATEVQFAKNPVLTFLVSETKFQPIFRLSEFIFSDC